jgi:hypothetical protein
MLRKSFIILMRKLISKSFNPTKAYFVRYTNIYMEKTDSLLTLHRQQLALILFFRLSLQLAIYFTGKRILILIKTPIIICIK